MPALLPTRELPPRLPVLRSPFSWEGEVYLEYSLQPRLVLSLNRATGVCSPVPRCLRPRLSPECSAPPSAPSPAAR